MKLKQLVVYGFAWFAISCGCTDDSFVSYSLNTFEQDVIPFTSMQTATYTTESMQTVTATITAKTVQEVNLRASDDESCATELVAQQWCSYQFSNSDLLYTVEVSKDSGNYTSLTIRTTAYEYYYLANQEIDNLEEALTTVTIDGYTFSDVFYLTNHNPDTTLEAIVYSSQNGIEYMKYRNGTALRIN